MMKKHLKALSVLVLSLLFVAALAGCGEEADTPVSGISVTVEASGVYEMLADAQNNSETAINADGSEMSGDYYFETTAPCNLAAYDKNGAILAETSLSDDYADRLVQVTLNDSMEFVLSEN